MKKCDEMEELSNKRNGFNTNEKIKEATGRVGKSNSGVMSDEQLYLKRMKN